MKKQFKVTTFHTVHIGSYENGEGKQVNFYSIDTEVKAETIREAIEHHFNNTIFLPFKFEEAETNEDKTVMFEAERFAEKGISLAAGRLRRLSLSYSVK